MVHFYNVSYLLTDRLCHKNQNESASNKLDVVLHISFEENISAYLLYSQVLLRPFESNELKTQG